MKTPAACFRFTDDVSSFIIMLVEQSKIDHARRILNGQEKRRVHVHGTVIKQAAPYNPGWSFHLDPASVDFFEFAIEVCDAAIQYVEDHLDEVCGSTLPNCHWCPWSSRLIEEVECCTD